MTLIALRLRARYPDNYLLRDELAKLCDMVVRLAEAGSK